MTLSLDSYRRVHFVGIGGIGMSALARLAARGGLLWGLALVLYVGLALWLAPSAFVVSAGQLLAVHLAFAAIACLLLIPVLGAPGAAERGLAQRVAGAPPVAWLGLISYGIFLWHFPVVLALGPAHGWLGFAALLAGTLVISTALAAVSYYALERPLMKLKYRSLPRRRLWLRTPDRSRV